MNKLFTILKFELMKFFKSVRGYILLLTGTVPLIIFLSISAEKSRLEYLVTGRIDLIQNALLVAYIFYSYILVIFFTIMVYSDILSNEKTYEFLLVSASRTTLLIGKIIISIILNLILLIETTVSFFLTLYSYNVRFPPILQIEKAYILSTFFCVCLVIPVVLFSNTLIIKIGNINFLLANYLAIFVFFVIPFIIYFSLFELSLFRSEMLTYSIHTVVQNLIQSVMLPNSTTSSSQQQQNVEVLLGIGILGYSSSILLFSKSSIIS